MQNSRLYCVSKFRRGDPCIPGIGRWLFFRTLYIVASAGRPGVHLTIVMGEFTVRTGAKKYPEKSSLGNLAGSGGAMERET